MLDGESGTYQIPLGNGFLLFYRGNRASAPYATETTPSYVPTADTLTASGYLNQGQVTVKDWYTPSSPNLGYSTISGSVNIQGYNLVGNPYPSAIDWDSYNTGTPNSGIYAPGVTDFLYVLDSKSKNYNVYQANTGGSGTIATSGSNVIPSGQGFFVVATDATAKLVFNESAKTSAQATAATGNLFLAVKQTPKDELDRYIHMEVIKDTLSRDGIILNFKKTADANYNKKEDAPYKIGNGSVSLASRSADGMNLAINSTPYPTNATPMLLVIGTNYRWYLYIKNG